MAANQAPGYIKNILAGAITEYDIYAMDVDPTHSIGDKTGDNLCRTFRYGHVAADTTMGLLVSQDISVASVVETDASVKTAVAAGGTSITFDNAVFASIVANQFAGALLGITDEAGEAYQYVIKSNTASANTDEVTVTLHDSIKVAVDTSATCIAIMGNPFIQLRGATSTDCYPVGVTVCTWVAATAAYGWIQTWGPALVLCNSDGGAVTKGSSVTLSDGVTGAYQLEDAYTEARIGYSLHAPDDTGYGWVFLQLAN